MPASDHRQHLIMMSEALEMYLQLKGHNRNKRFEGYAYRALEYLFDVAGDKALSLYSRSDANALRDILKMDAASCAKRGCHP